MSRLADGRSAGTSSVSIWRRSIDWRLFAGRSASLFLCTLQIACATGGASSFDERVSYPEICLEIACRPTVYGSMFYGDGGRIRFPVHGGPYVHDGRIHILRGEDFRVEPRMVRGEVAELSYLANPVSPRSTFFVSLQRKDGFAVLEFENPFSGPVLFRAAAIDSETYRHSDERSCSIGPQERIAGRWFSGIDGVVIYNVEFVESSAWQSGCW